MAVAVQAKVVRVGEPLPVWEILEMELHNALYLKVFRDELSDTEADRQHLLFQQRKTTGLYFVPEIGRGELRAEFRRLSALTPRLGCRTMNILHVACACQLKPDRFLSFDTRPNEIAMAAGLAVL